MILAYINDNNYNDVFTITNDFYNQYGVNLYLYIRVSTKEQEFTRQLKEVYEWAKKKNITIFIDNIYCDKFTGKTLKRKEYEKLRQQTKKNDYILVTEISRIGRDWDSVKNEWYLLKASNINILVMDFDNLSSPLPYETSESISVEKKFIQDLVFSGVLYASCKKIEEVSKSTKAGLQVAKSNGKHLGRPTDNDISVENFIKTLKYQVDYGYTVDLSLDITKYPKSTFILNLKKYREMYNLQKSDKCYKIKLINILKGNDLNDTI